MAQARISHRSLVSISLNLPRCMLPLLLCFLIAAAVVPQAAEAQCLTNVNMNTWSKQGPPFNGLWTVQGGGARVYQTRNDPPSFFISPYELINVRITGTLRVDANVWDDDYIGFVFGYQDPLGNDSTSHDLWLFDWKRNTQSYVNLLAPEGFHLTRINGTINTLDQVHRYFWNHETNPPLSNCVDSLLRKHSALGAGWQPGRTYSFSLTYTSVRIEIRIDNQIIIQRTGCFQPGRFGFYNYSQEQVTYADFNYSLLADFTADRNFICRGETVNFSSVNTTCSTIPTNIKSWHWNFGDGNSSSSINPSHVFNTSGSFPVTLTITDNYNCVDSVTKVITVSAGPPANAGPDVGICPGDFSIIGNSTVGGVPPITYSWTPSTGLSSTTIAQPTASPAVTTTYTLTVTDGNGCSNSDDVTVTVHSPPTARAGANQSNCGIESVTIGLPATGGTGPFLYSWTPATALSATNIAQPSANPAVTTTYTVTVTDANGCQDQDDVTVTVNPRPIADAGADIDLCRGSSTPIGNPANGGTPGYQYLWQPADGLSSNTIATPTAAPVRTTTYQQIVTDANGCSDTAEVTINIIDLPPPVIDGPITVCPNSDWTYASNMGTGTQHTWSIDPPTAGSITSGQGTPEIQISWSGPGTATLLLVLDSAGCTSNSDLRIRITDNLDVNINNRGDKDTLGYCPGHSLVLDAGPGFSSYLWSPGGEQTQTISVQQPWTYSVTVRDAFGCEGSDTVYVVEYQNPLPLIEPAGPHMLCQGDSLILSVPGPYVSYNWSTGGTSDQIVVRQSGNYTVTVVDNNGCEGTSPPVSVTMVSRPEPYISGDTAACLNAVREYNILIPSSGTYAWSIDESMGTLISQSGTKAQVRWTSMGRAWVIVTETDPTSGCTGSDTLWVTVGEGLTPMIIGDTTLCEGSTITLSVTGGPFETHEWFRNGNPVSGGTDSTLDVTLSGSYTVQVEAGDCSGEADPHVVSVVPAPTPSISPPGPHELCAGDTLRLSVAGSYDAISWSTGETGTAITVRDAGTYSVTVDSLGCSGTSEEVVVTLVDFPDDVISGADVACLNSRNEYRVTNDPAFSYAWTITGGTLISGAGTAAVTVQWTDSLGCRVVVVVTHVSSGCETTLALDVTIDRALRPSISLTGAPVICRDGEIVLRAGHGYMAYRWYRDGAALAGENRDSLVVSQSGDYSVEVTDAGGCSGVSAEVTITVSNLPVPVIVAGGPTTFCRGDSVTLSVSGSFASFRWSTGESTASITVKTSGSYRVDVVDANGCTGASDPITVVERPITPPVISGPASLCRSNTDAQEYSVVNETGMTFSWETVGSSSQTPVAGNRISVVWGSVDVGLVIVTKTESSVGCVARDTLRVVIGDSLSPVLLANGGRPPGPAHTLCSGEQLQLSVQGQFHSYTWSTGATTPSISVNQTGIYSVQVTDTTGCSGTSMQFTVVVATPPLPVITPDGPLQFCRGDSVRLTVSEEFAAYSWSNGQNTRSILVSTGATYTVTVTDENGCSGTSAPVVVTVSPPDALVIDGPSSVCLDEQVEYRSTQGGAGFTYTWSIVGPGSSAGSIVSGQGTQSVRVQWPGTGAGTVELTVHDPQSGCTSTTSLLVTVGNGITPVITSSTGNIVCTGIDVELCTEEGDSYLWSPGGATTRCITVSDAGSWTVTVSRGSCSGSSGAFVVERVADPPPPSITADRERFCLGESASLDAGPGFSSYTWLLDGQPTGDTTRTISVSPLTGGEYRYSVVVTNAYGCQSGSGEQVINVFPPVTPRLSESGAEVLCDPAGTTYTYQWYINDTLVAGAAADRVSIERTGLYVVRITDTNGCSAWSDPLPIVARIANTSMAFSCPAQIMKVGEQFVLPFELLASENLDQAGPRELELQLRFNGTVLHPMFTPFDQQTDGNDRIVRIAINRDAAMNSGVLADLAFTALFGNSDCSEIRIESLRWTDGTAIVTIADTVCNVCIEVCRAGGTRLYSTQGRLALTQNRPNPFNTTTVFEYEVIENGPTTLYVIDMMGRRVSTLVDGIVEPGRYVTRFDGSTLPSGSYIYVLQTPTQVIHNLMVLVK